MIKSNVKIFTPINLIGFILVMVAGWVDAVGFFLFLNERSSFMTGRAAELGKCIFYGETQGIKFLLLIVLSFILGAYISASITRKIGLSYGLLFAGSILIISSFHFFSR